MSKALYDCWFAIYIFDYRVFYKGEIVYVFLMILKRDEAKKFLYELNIAEIYNSKCCAGLNSFVENYSGNNKEYLEKVMKYINKRNSKSNSRFFGIGKLDLELILDETLR